jgi:succinyl-diaminopimelate desuccinylase
MKQIFNHIDRNQDSTIHLLQQFIRIPSPTYQEGMLAEFVKDKLEAIGLTTYINPLGDVTGVFNGASREAALFVLNTHLDQADAGDMEDPFSGKIIGGSKFGVTGDVIYGRGANGQKACLAAMIAAAQAVLDIDTNFRRGFAINAGVMEECGGHLSPEYLIKYDKLPVSAVLCGEHTDLKPVNRQRGMTHIYLKINGKGAHAAAPEGSSSALIGMAKVILALENLNRNLPKDVIYGDALVSLNKLEIIPNVINAIPGICEAVVDVRYPASLSRQDIESTIRNCIAETISHQEGLSHTAEVKRLPVTSYTGYEGMSNGGMHPFFTAVDDPLTIALRASIDEVTGEDVDSELWSISSEAGYFSTVAGLPVVAFGPGEDRFTHNNLEHVRVEDVIITAKVYAAMIHRMCTVG